MQMNRKYTNMCPPIIICHILHLKMDEHEALLGIQHLLKSWLLLYTFMLNKMSCFGLAHCAKQHLSEKNCISSRVRLVFHLRALV